MNKIKKKFIDLIKSGNTFFGTFIQSSSEELVEIAGYTGFDFGIIDMEHGSFGIDKVHGLLRASDASEMVSIVRVPSNKPEHISKALDAGASGVVIPGISSVEDAKKAIQFAKYYPEGIRGACPCVRANNYGAENNKFYPNSNNEGTITILVEGVDGVNAVDDIISLESVDSILLGPVDLSHSLGVPGDIYNPLVIKTITDVIKKANQKDVCIGVFCFDFESAKKWVDLGADYIVYSTDTMIVYNSYSKLVKKLTNLRKVDAIE